VTGNGDFRVVTLADSEDPDAWLESRWPVLRDAWPAYNLHGDVLNALWGELDERYPDFQFVLTDEDGIAGLGNCVPLRWDGTVNGLPSGIDDALTRAVEDHRAGREPNAACALQGVIVPERRGRGLAAAPILAMRGLAAARGLRGLIAPVRPNWKERYPLTPIERYAAWTRADGMPFDPWIRVHVRLGAEILKPAPQSARITGTVAEWEEWTEMAFPESGEYVFPRGLAPLHVDRERDRGEYWEPNVWLHHPF
jgi:GNAT superfamily N-acetyltransferase